MSADPKQNTEIGFTPVMEGSREGSDYRFVGDESSLRKMAVLILARLDGLQSGPWETDPSIILCEQVSFENRPAFLSFQIKSRGDSKK
jgi:hypothetical protein